MFPLAHVENILKFKMDHIWPRIPVSHLFPTSVQAVSQNCQKCFEYVVNNNNEILKLVSLLPVMCSAFLIIE